MTPPLALVHGQDIAPDAPDGVVMLVLDQPGRPVVVLDADLIDAIDAALDEVPADATGFVLASASERSFVAGADLKAIQSLDDDALHAYLSRAAAVYQRIADMPCTTVAAINGAALGGGLELAMHADVLIGAPAANGKDYPIGLPEAGLGICPGWGGTNLLPARMDPAEAIERTAKGEPLTYSAAKAAGLFDATVDDPADLRLTAARMAAQPRVRRPDGEPMQWIGAEDTRKRVADALDTVNLPDTGAAQAVRACIETGIRDGWSAALDRERTELVRLRHTDAAAAAIRAFFERSSKK